MTAVQGADGENLLDAENKKAQKHVEKALGSVKLKILDDFNRRQLDKDLSTRVEKASRMAKQVMTLSLKSRSEHHTKGRDEKIRMIKINQQREAMIEQDREMKRLRKEEDEIARRLQEIEAKRLDEIRKRELEYRQKREAVVKFGAQKEVSEIEACREFMRHIETKIDRSGEKQRMIMTEKVSRVQEHNTDVIEKK